MARLLKELKIGEISSVDRGAAIGATILLMKRDDPTGAEMTVDQILKVAPAESLPGIVEKLFGHDDYDPTKTITDLLESRVVVKKEDRTRSGSWLASFTGPMARDPVGKQILAVWHRNEHRLIAVRKRKAKAMPDTGNGSTPHAHAEAGDAAGDFDKLVDQYAAQNKCSKASATSAVMKTAAGTQLYREARDRRLVEQAQG